MSRVNLVRIDNTYNMRSAVMLEVLEKCSFIAPSQKPVCIIGDFGSGKGWIANKIHETGRGRDRAFSRINCYSMYAEEVRRKLYGYLTTQGQSVRVNKGLFEETHNGTIFIEGFETLPAELQLNIIESVQRQTIRHTGSSLNISINVRLITSMNEQSFWASEQNARTENSIFRINPFMIFLPPLQHRREDILPLVHSFLNASYLDERKTAIKDITPKALRLYIQYDWPGNVRQLKNAVKQAALISDGSHLDVSHLPESIREALPDEEKLQDVHKSKSFQQAEKNLIRSLLLSEGSPENVAARLELSLKTLNEKIEKYDL